MGHIETQSSVVVIAMVCLTILLWHTISLIFRYITESQEMIKEVRIAKYKYQDAKSVEETESNKPGK